MLDQFAWGDLACFVPRPPWMLLLLFGLAASDVAVLNSTLTSLFAGQAPRLEMAPLGEDFIGEDPAGAPRSSSTAIFSHCSARRFRTAFSWESVAFSPSSVHRNAC
jgi:hypothetical protein